MSNDALRPRAGAVTLTSLLLTAATVYAANNVHLRHSFEARQSEWIDLCGCGDDESRYRPVVSCADRADDDHCYRELYRAVVEAQEANADYYEMQQLSPTGASFATPTIVRRPPAEHERGNATYARIGSSR